MRRPPRARLAALAYASMAAIVAYATANVVAGLVARPSSMPATATVHAGADVVPSRRADAVTLTQDDDIPAVPWLPGPVGQLGGGIRAVAVNASGGGDVAWIAHGTRIASLSVAADGAMDALGESVPLGGLVADVAVDGGIAVAVTEDTGRLVTLDVADPLAPAVRASIALAGAGNTVVLHNGFAYAIRYVSSAGDDGGTFLVGTVAIVDVRDPARPRVVTLDALAPGRRKVHDIAVVGNRLAVAARGGGPNTWDGPHRLDVYGIAPDGGLTWLGEHADSQWDHLAPGPAGTDTVYGADNDVIAADLGDGAAPRIVGRWAVGACSPSVLAVSRVGRPYLFTMPCDDRDSPAAVVAPARDGDDPASADAFPLRPQVSAMAFAGGHLVVASYDAHLRSFATSPRLALAASEPRSGALIGSPVALAIAEQDGDAVLHAALDGTTLATFNLDDPARPRLVGRAEGNGDPDNMATAGGYTLVSTWADDGGNLTYPVFETHDPAAPRQLGTIGKNAFIARATAGATGADAAWAWIGAWGDDESAGFPSVIDVFRLPPEPSLAPVAEIALTLDLNDFALQGDRLVAVGYDPFTAGSARVPMLEVWDIATPEAPVRLSAVRFGGPRSKYDHGVQVAFDGRYAFVAMPATGDGGTPTVGTRLLVIDLADPRSPRTVAQMPHPYRIGPMAIGDGLLFVPTGCGPLWQPCVEVVDVRTPTAPRTIGAYATTGGRGDSLAVYRGRLYVAAYWSGLAVFDLPAIPASPPDRHWSVALPWAGRNVVRTRHAQSPDGPPPAGTPRPTADPAATPFTAAPVGQVGGAIQAMAADGDTVWMGYGPRVAALALDDPRAPALVGRTPVLDDIVLGLAVRDGLGVTVTGPARGAGATLVTFDAHDRATPRILGRLALPGAVGPVALVPGWAFVIRAVDGDAVDSGADGSRDAPGSVDATGKVDVLEEVDVRDPAHPLLRRRLVDANAIDVVAVGDVVAASVGDRPGIGREVVTRLELFAAFDGDGVPQTRAAHTDESWYGLAAGPPGQALVYGIRSGAIALDVRDPARPREAGRWGDRSANVGCIACRRLAVTASGQPYVTAFGGYGGGGVVALPREGETAPDRWHGASTSSPPAGGIAAVGARIVAAGRGGTVEVFEPDRWTEKETDPIATLSLLSQVNALAFRADADDGLLYATLYEGGLREMSMAQPRDLPIVASEVDDIGRTRLSVAGGFGTTLFQRDGDQLFFVSDLFDLRDPTRPRFMDKVWGSGEIARIMTGGGGPRDDKIVESGLVESGTGDGGPWLVTSVFRSRSLHRPGIQLFDLSQPPPEIEPIQLSVAFEPTDIAVDASRLAAVGSRTDVEFWDLSDPKHARRDAAVHIASPWLNANGMPVVALGPAAAYVASATAVDRADDAQASRITAIDLASPDLPRLGATVAITGAITSLTYADGYLFAGGADCPGSDSACVAVLDAGDAGDVGALHALHVVGWLRSGAAAGLSVGSERDAVAVRGGRVFVAGGDGGIWVFEPPLSWPARATEGGRVVLPWVGRRPGE
ncbi:MAG: hypothetical protein ABI780_05845 [Ardenticatenales bacterium]